MAEVDELAELIKAIASEPQLQDYAVKQYTNAKIPVPVVGNWMLSTLAALAISEYSSANLKMKAIGMLLDRGWGKTPDTVHHTHQGKLTAEDLSDDDLARFIAGSSITLGEGE